MATNFVCTQFSPAEIRSRNYDYNHETANIVDSVHVIRCNFAGQAEKVQERVVLFRISLESAISSWLRTRKALEVLARLKLDPKKITIRFLEQHLDDLVGFEKCLAMWGILDLSIETIDTRTANLAFPRNENTIHDPIADEQFWRITHPSLGEKPFESGGESFDPDKEAACQTTSSEKR